MKAVFVKEEMCIFACFIKDCDIFGFQVHCVVCVESFGIVGGVCECGHACVRACMHVCDECVCVCVCVCVYTDAYSGYTHTVGTYCTLYSISVLCTVSVFGIIISAKKRKTESFF